MLKKSSLVVCIPGEIGLSAENRSKKQLFHNICTTKVEKLSRTADAINPGM
jgi:hypothetical protein